MGETVPLLGRKASSIWSPSSESELRIVLVGKTGAGKSSSGNTILGSEKFTAEASPVAVTNLCKERSVDHRGRRIHVVDTPGIFGSLSEEEMEEQINQCVRMCVPGPHVFLLVISLGRYTHEEKNAVNWIQRNFGEDAAHYTIVLFTHADQLRSKSLEKFINESQDLLQLIENCGQRYHAFNNQDKRNNQVLQLLEKIDTMVEWNGGQHYTNEMFRKAQEEMRKEGRRQKIKEVALGAATAVGLGGVVAGGVVFGVTGAVILPAVGAIAGAALAVGTGAKLIYNKAKNKTVSVQKVE